METVRPASEASAWTLIVLGALVLVLMVVTGAVLAATTCACGRGRDETCRTDAQAIRSAAQNWMMEHNDECPTLDQLRSDGMLDRSGHETDPWGHAFTIVCAHDELVVTSRGPDGIPGTEDDLGTARFP
jgi:competence protein ComGC